MRFVDAQEAEGEQASPSHHPKSTLDPVVLLLKILPPLPLALGVNCNFLLVLCNQGPGSLRYCRVHPALGTLASALPLLDPSFLLGPAAQPQGLLGAGGGHLLPVPRRAGLRTGA